MTTTIFGYIFTNRIQTFKAANYISAAFFLCRPMMKHYNCHTFLNKFQDDISCALAMYSYMWDWLYKPALYTVLYGTTVQLWQLETQLLWQYQG